MGRQWIVRFVALIVALGVLTGSAFADFQVGQSVEVQRGAEWVPATVTRKINGNYQIRYATGGLTVVSPGRVRAVAGAADAPGADAGSSDDAASPASPTPESPMWRPHQKVEVKSGGSWDEATIIRRQGEWWLVSYRDGTFGEWVEPWRIREVGSDEDNIGFVRPNKELVRNRRMPAPPKHAPGEPPLSFEARVERMRAASDSRGGAAAPEAGGGAESLEAVRAAWAEAPEFPEPPSAGQIQIDPARGDVPPRGSMGLGNANLTRSAMVVARGAPIAVVASGMPDITLYRIDLSKRAVLDSTEVGEHLELADVSADGTRALLLANTFGEKNVRVWQLGSRPALVAQMVVGLNPFGDSAAPEWAAFTPDGDVLTLDREGRVGLWDVESQKLTHQVKFDERARPALSPGGRLLAGAQAGQVVLIDLQAKVICGRFPGDRILRTVAFPPDGRHLFVGGFPDFHMYDLVTGEQVAKGSQSLRDGATFVDAEHYFDGSSQITNLKGRSVVNYVRTRGTVTVGPRGVLLHASGGTRLDAARLAWVAQPHAEGIAAAAAWNPKDHLLIPPGARVAASVEGSFDVGSASDATARLQAALTEAGYVIDPSSRTRFKGSVTTGETRKQRFEKMREFGVAVEVSVTPREYKLVAEVDGKFVWQRSGATGPGTILYEKKDQTLQQQIDEQTRSNPNWFGSAIPSEFADTYRPTPTNFPQ